MKSLFAWEWTKNYLPPAVVRERNVMVRIFDVDIAPGSREKFPDPTALRNSDVCFITGDAHTLAADVAEFNSWDIDHDIYAVNRSLVFHERPVRHWAAVDVEEACWFTEFVNDKVDPDRRLIRHSIGTESKHGNPMWPGLFDCYWEMLHDFENDLQRTVFVGNSGYFAVLSALKMGYKQIILGGMPLDTGPHFYEPASTQGPLWTGMTFMQWIDFKQKHPGADRVRSMGGYSAFILGRAGRYDRR